MADQLARDIVNGPLGCFEVSTIRTFSGGGSNTKSAASPFSDADYVDKTPWPYETMVFPAQAGSAVYHAPYATKEDALKGHALMVKTIQMGTEFGGGVKGPFGVPSITPEEWRARVNARKGEKDSQEKEP